MATYGTLPTITAHITLALHDGVEFVPSRIVSDLAMVSLRDRANPGGGAGLSGSAATLRALAAALEQAAATLDAPRG